MGRWRLAKSLVTLQRQVNDLCPRRSRRHDGTIGDAAHAARKSDHNPWVRDASGIGVVTAMDITHDPGNGCDAEAITGALVCSRDQRIKYIIWNRRIVSSLHDWKWRDYTGPNPHDQHFHISVTPRRYDEEQEWSIST